MRKTHYIPITADVPGAANDANCALIRRTIRTALAAEGLTAPCEVDVLLTDDDGIHEINRELRQGIGRQAFDFMSAYCREHHATAFICHCVPENFNARSFYERMGGEVIGEDLTNEERWQNSVTYQFTLPSKVT